MASEERYEIKFLAPLSSISLYRQWIEQLPYSFSEAYPSRIVNNIYFDTLDLKAYRENLSGDSKRTKARFRWYGENNTIQSGNFEIKYKRNRLGMKSLEKIELDKDLKKISLHQIYRSIASKLNDAHKIVFEEYCTPVLFNTYKREYYASSDQSLRITIDESLLFYDQQSYQRLNTKWSTAETPYIVLEVKFPHTKAAKGKEILRSIPATPSKSSKYVVGIQSSLGV